MITSMGATLEISVYSDVDFYMQNQKHKISLTLALRYNHHYVTHERYIFNHQIITTIFCDVLQKKQFLIIYHGMCHMKVPDRISGKYYLTVNYEQF